MADGELPRRVFDSLTGAVANAEPPGAAPYQDVPETAGDEEPDTATAASRPTPPAPVKEEPPEEKTVPPAKPRKGTTARAGSAGVRAQAKDTK